MQVQTFYNVFHEGAMGWIIVIYFFLTGISSGAFLLSVVCRVWAGERFDKVKRIGAFVAPPFLAGGLVFLIIDLGKPLRFWRMFLHFNPTSVASWGVWLMTIFFLITLVHAYFSWIQDEEKSKIIAVVGSPFAVAVSLYSGFILVQMKAYELWHSAIVPMLFSVSAIVSAISLIILIAILVKVEKDVIKRLGKFLVWFVALDLLFVVVKIFSFFLGHEDAVDVVRLLLIGKYAPLFMGLYIVIGLLVPIVVLSRKALSQRGEAVASILVIIGTFAMRYAVVMGGQYFPLS